MKIHFWGVRGSLPTPIVPEQIQSKLMAVVQRIQPSDLENGETRARFVASLPDWILGTTGGNTPCVEIQDGNTEIILDAGTGIRVLGKNPSNITSNHFHLFFSHFHWDHIQGLPFFDQAYNPNTIFDIYSAKENTEELLREQMKHPYYPVGFDSLTKNMTFHNVKQGQAFQVDSFKVNCCNMSHPGISTCYAFEKDGKKVVYATDVELKTKDFASNPECAAVFKDAEINGLEHVRSPEHKSGYNSRTAERRKEVVAGEDKHQQHYTHYGSDCKTACCHLSPSPFTARRRWIRPTISAIP